MKNRWGSQVGKNMPWVVMRRCRFVPVPTWTCFATDAMSDL